MAQFNLRLGPAFQLSRNEQWQDRLQDTGADCTGIWTSHNPPCTSPKGARGFILSVKGQCEDDFSIVTIWNEMNRTQSWTHVAENDLLVFGVFQGVCVMWNLVALGFDFVPGSGVVFLLTEKSEHYQHVVAREHAVYKADIFNLSATEREICLYSLTLLKKCLKLWHLA